MAEQICRICGKGPYKRLDQHLDKAHNMTIDDYNKEDEFEEIEEGENIPEERVSVNKKDITKDIFKGASKDNYPRDLDEFLSHFEITEKELISIIKRYKNGQSISATQTIERTTDSAEKKAAELAESGENSLSVHSVYIAEALTTKHGYTVVRVTSQPKTWVLTKNK